MNGADTMICMYSASSSNVDLTLNVFFEIGANPELTQAGVQNGERHVLPRPPEQIQFQGIQVQKKSSTFNAAQVPQ